MISQVCALLERFATATSVHAHEPLQQYDAASPLLKGIVVIADSDENLMRAAIAEQRFIHNLGLAVVKLLQHMPVASRNAVKTASTLLILYVQALAYILKTDGGGDAAREKVANIRDAVGQWTLLCISSLQVPELWCRSVLS